MSPSQIREASLSDRGNYLASRRSSALIIVLGCLALISILIVAFMASVATERQSAQYFANSSSVKLLADSAVSLIIGQIQDATKGVDSSGNTLSWASQPGMIRTYNTSGQAAGFYKLYSWANMVGTGSFTPSATTETPPSTWMQSPALYTDLNDPVSGVYPIVDPAATNFVQGFSITGAPVSSADAAPMPVQWLYILQDGSVATASGGVGNTVTVTGAGPGNRIVARIAFWADDETSKVNINTAAGDVWSNSSSPPAAGQPGNPGSLWDIPRTDSTYERTYMAKYQPAQNEYQRYPGHPATTYLSTVFTNLTEANIYAIAPRVTQGGSLSGTAVATSAITPDNDRLYGSVDELMFTTNLSSASRTTNAPLSESAIEQAQFFLTAHSRAPEVNLFNEPRVVIWPVSAQTNSSSGTYQSPYDELIGYCGSLVGTNNATGALNTNAYYFQRASYEVTSTQGCNSQTTDLPALASASGLGRNRALISYLRNLTSLPIPGFSTTSSQTFLGKYPVDRDEILTEIFDYIRSVNAQDTSISGLQTYALTSASTLGATGQGQILPIIDTVHSDSNTTSTLRGFGRFPTVREAGFVFVGVGQTTTTGTSTPPMSIQNPGTAIATGNTRVQAFFYLNFFDPNQGYAISVPNFQVQISSLNNFKWGASTAGTSMGFTSPFTYKITRNPDTGNYGGYKGASPFLDNIFTLSSGNSTTSFLSGVIDLPTSGTFAFGGGSVQVQILDSTGSNVLQTLTIPFPAGTFPTPLLAPQLQDTGSPALTTDFRNLAAYTGSYGSAPATVGRFTGSGNVNTSASTSSKMWLCSKDVVRSVEADTDPRIIAAQYTVPASDFSEIEPQYGSSSVFQAHGIAESENGGSLYDYNGCIPGKFVANANYGSPGGAGAPAAITTTGDLVYPGNYTSDGLQPVAQPNSSLGGYPMPIAFGVSSGQCVAINGVYAGTNSTGAGLLNPPGDFDTGMGLTADGAFVNKADEGSISGITSGSLAYYEGLIVETVPGSTFSSPNRQLPSPVNFGSLPTGVESNAPWQTLLFHPDPGGTPQHMGAQSPPDYLLLDLFNMPVVEPYAISDPFSTAGKVNMNYQIVPFTYLTRATAVEAVLKPEQIMALASNTTTNDAATYKSSTAFANRRNYLDLNQTLVGFQNRFNTGDIFRSASEICKLWLVPANLGLTLSSSDSANATTMQTFWNQYPLTGDNVRERPYGDIYARLTTKSNSFTVHYRVQTLKKISSTPTNQWVQGSDVVVAEYRGSSTLERYLDTSSTAIPDYATLSQPLTSGQAIDNFYKFRVVETKQFTP